jgi:hypothetical protein
MLPLWAREPGNTAWKTKAGFECLFPMRSKKILVSVGFLL